MSEELDINSIVWREFDDSVWATYKKQRIIKQVKYQEYYDSILEDIDIKYIEIYLRRKKLKNINKQ